MNPIIPSRPAGRKRSPSDYLTRRNVLFAVAGVGVVALLIGVLLTSGVFGFGSNRPVPSAAGVPTSVVDPNAGAIIGTAVPSQTSLPNANATDPRFAFVLLGYGGGSHEGGYLTDSMVVGIADPDKKTIALLSIPRDCWVPMSFDGKTAIYNKVNTAYAFGKDPYLYSNRLARYEGNQGAGHFTNDTLSRLLGIPLSNYLSLDFAGFREMIDAVGGVDVEVPSSFSSLYPAADDPAIDPRWITISFRKGQEHMTGERAIRFARAREVLDNPAESNDFGRSRRQKLIIEAFKTKLLDPAGLLRLPQILAIAGDHVDTDYGLGDVAQLSQFLLQWKDVKFYQAALTVDNYLTTGTGPDNAFVLAPNNSAMSWDQIRAFTRRLWKEPAVGAAMADTQIIVVNNSGQKSVATKLSAYLKSQGYRVGPPQDGETTVESNVVDRSGGQASVLVAALQQDLNVRLPVEAYGADEYTTKVLELHIGSADVGLADLVAQKDEEAPTSAYAVDISEGWMPIIEPTATPVKPKGTPRASGTPDDTADDATTGTVTAGSKTATGSLTPAATTSAKTATKAAATPTKAPAAAVKTATPTKKAVPTATKAPVKTPTPAH